MNFAEYYFSFIKLGFYLFLCCAMLCLLLSRVRLSVTPWTVAHQAPLSIRVLQTRILEWVACPPPGYIPNPGVEPRSPTLQADFFYHLSHQGSSWILEWLSYPFSRGSSHPRNLTRVSCIADGFFTSWATREAHYFVNTV